MDTRTLPTEEELEQLLTEDSDLFMQALFLYYGEKIMACIGIASRDRLNEHELADAFQDTMMEVLEKVRSDDFDRQRPLRMVFRIAKCRAIDHARRKLGLRRKAKQRELTDMIIQDLSGSDLGLDWKYVAREEQERFNAVLPEIIDGLPERQKAAANAFLLCYEEIRPNDRYKPLADAMSVITGQRETVDAVKSAFRHALDGIRNELKRQGFDFVEGRLT